MTISRTVASVGPRGDADALYLLAAATAVFAADAHYPELDEARSRLVAAG